MISWHKLWHKYILFYIPIITFGLNFETVFVGIFKYNLWKNLCFGYTFHKVQIQWFVWNAFQKPWYNLDKLIKICDRITWTAAACGKDDLCNPCVRLWFSPRFFWWMWILMLSFPFLCWMLMLKCSLRCKRKIWDTGTLQVRQSRWVELPYSIKLTSFSHSTNTTLQICFEFGFG